jgi:hypothetical protein
LVYDSGPGTTCDVPAVAGKFWIQTVNHGKPEVTPLDLDGNSHVISQGADNHEWHALVSLDVSNPAKPVEVGRLNFAAQDRPHWVSVDSQGTRLAVTGFEKLQNQIVIVNLGKNGELTFDSRFHDSRSGNEPGIRFENEHWPHGGAGLAVPHGVVFSR